jgi:predicted negative regulator of RcsB-dependent stress response
VAINAAEEETLEALKKWWEENGKQLVAAVVIVAAGFGGWNFWEGQQLAKQGAASDLYEEILELTLVDPGQQVAAQDANRIISGKITRSQPTHRSVRFSLRLSTSRATISKRQRPLFSG